MQHDAGGVGHAEHVHVAIQLQAAISTFLGPASKHEGLIDWLVNLPVRRG